MAIGGSAYEGIHPRVQHGADLLRLDALHGGGLVDHTLAHQVDGDLHGRGRAALARARLQHVELAGLDGEFEVLHLAVVLLQPRCVFLEFGKGLGHGCLERGDCLRGAHAGHHILALGVEEVLAKELPLAGVGIAREGHARARGLAHVAEHHRLDVDRRAPVIGKSIDPAVVHGAASEPRVEHRADRMIELLVRVVGKLGLGGVANDPAEVGRHRLPVRRIEIGVMGRAEPGLVGVDAFLERVAVHAQDDRSKPLDEAAVGVPAEACVAGPRDKPLERGLIQTQVEHRVHHAGHGHARAGAYRHEQRVLRVAEAPPHR